MQGFFLHPHVCLLALADSRSLVQPYFTDVWNLLCLLNYLLMQLEPAMQTFCMESRAKLRPESAAYSSLQLSVDTRRVLAANKS